MTNKQKSEDREAQKKTTRTELVPRADDTMLRRTGQGNNDGIQRYTRVDLKTNARQMYQHDPQMNSQMYLYSYDSREDPSFKDKFNEKDGKGCIIQRRAAFYSSSTPRDRRPNYESRVQEISDSYDENKSNTRRAAGEPIVEEPDDNRITQWEGSNRNSNSLMLPAGNNNLFEDMQRRMEKHMARVETVFQDFGMLSRGRFAFDDAFPQGFTMSDDWPFQGSFFGSGNRSKHHRQSGL